MVPSLAAPELSELVAESVTFSFSGSSRQDVNPYVRARSGMDADASTKAASSLTRHMSSEYRRVLSQ